MDKVTEIVLNQLLAKVETLEAQVKELSRRIAYIEALEKED